LCDCNMPRHPACPAATVAGDEPPAHGGLTARKPGTEVARAPHDSGTSENEHVIMTLRLSAGTQ
jgi:hypothetical protein